jgi:hypothetical protein
MDEVENFFLPISKITIRNASKRGKPDKKPCHPYDLRNNTKQLINEENSSLFNNSILYWRKEIKKVETSSLRNLKIMPKNLNEIVLLWIASQYAWAQRVLHLSE